MKIKMYILVKEELSAGHVALVAAHSSLAGYLKFKEDENTKEWADKGPFFKVICQVNEKEFEKAKTYDDHIVMTESSLENKEVAIVFKPMKENEIPKFFKFLKLYK